MVQREAGRLECSIRADARGFSDVRLPTVPRACEPAGVRVVRRPGLVFAAPGDELVLVALQRLFPILSAAEPDRLSLARSVLVLNVSGGLADEVLVDAALFGVPCVGTDEVDAQAMLWPELATSDRLLAVAIARELLTNAARSRRLIESAFQACRDVFAPSEDEAAQTLRGLKALEGAQAG